MKDNKEKKYSDREIGTYEFVPEYNRWIELNKQKEIVKKLENITKIKENNDE